LANENILESGGKTSLYGKLRMGAQM